MCSIRSFWSPGRSEFSIHFGQHTIMKVVALAFCLSQKRFNPYIHPYTEDVAQLVYETFQQTIYQCVPLFIQCSLEHYPFWASITKFFFSSFKREYELLFYILKDRKWYSLVRLCIGLMWMWMYYMVAIISCMSFSVSIWICVCVCVWQRIRAWDALYIRLIVFFYYMYKETKTGEPSRDYSEKGGNCHLRELDLFPSICYCMPFGE